MSEKLQNYIDLSRIKKPIGFMLLFWPCLWGLTSAYDFNNSIITNNGSSNDNSDSVIINVNKKKECATSISEQ